MVSLDNIECKFCVPPACGVYRSSTSTRNTSFLFNRRFTTVSGGFAFIDGHFGSVIEIQVFSLTGDLTRSTSESRAPTRHEVRKSFAPL